MYVIMMIECEHTIFVQVCEIMLFIYKKKSLISSVVESPGVLCSPLPSASGDVHVTLQGFSVTKGQRPRP